MPASCPDSLTQQRPHSHRQGHLSRDRGCRDTHRGWAARPQLVGPELGSACKLLSKPYMSPRVVCGQNKRSKEKKIQQNELFSSQRPRRRCCRPDAASGGRSTMGLETLHATADRPKWFLPASGLNMKFLPYHTFCIYLEFLMAYKYVKKILSIMCHTRKWKLYTEAM